MLPGLAPTPGRISGPAERSEPPAGGPGKEAAQRQGNNKCHLSMPPTPTRDAAEVDATGGFTRVSYPSPRL
eukprot:844852-Prorocentrum_minimum.AAC.1